MSNRSRRVEEFFALKAMTASPDSSPSDLSYAEPENKRALHALVPAEC